MAHLLAPIRKEEDTTEEQEQGNPNPFSMLGGMLGLSSDKENKANPKVKAAVDEKSKDENEKYFQEKFPEETKAPEKEFDVETALETLRGTANYEKLKSKIKLLTPQQQKTAIEYAIKCQNLLKKKKEEKEKAELASGVGMGLSSNLSSSEVVVSQSDFEDEELLDATRNGRTEDLKRLLTLYNRSPSTSVIAKGDAEAHPLLHWAALEDQVETLRELIAMGTDPNAVNPRGECAIHWACIRGHIRCVHNLLEHGARIDMPDARGYSPMHHASQFGKTTVMALLHRRGAFIDTRDNKGRTPLHWASYKNEAQAVTWLICHGADISAQDWENCMPLHWAALQGLPDLTSTLMRNGALEYISEKDKTGFTAGQLALNKSQKFEKNTYEYRRYIKVGNYLEGCRTKGRDTDPRNHNQMHWSWYLWLLMSPPGFYQYYTYVFPATMYLYPLLNLVFVTFYFGLWLSWTMLQVKDPGYITLDRKPSPWHRKNVFNNVLCCYGYSGLTPNAYSNLDSTNAKEERALIAQRETRYTVPNPQVKDSQHYRDLYGEVLDKGLLVPVCTHCEIVRPLRSKHDRFTNRCVSKFDHFCPWVGVAIGGNNYREFVAMLISGMLCMNVWVYLVVIYTWNYRTNQSFWSNFYELGWWELFAWLYAPIALYATIMSVQHIYLLLQNLSTNEMINKFKYKYLSNNRNPFSRGKLSNMAEFLGFVDPVEVNIRVYHKYLFDGGSDTDQFRPSPASNKPSTYGQAGSSIYTNDISLQDVQASTLPGALNTV